MLVCVYSSRCPAFMEHVHVQLKNAPFPYCPILLLYILPVPSTITAHPSSVYVAEGQNATLSCMAMGSAPLNITWQRAGSSSSTELSVGSNVYIMETAIPNEEEV